MGTRNNKLKVIDLFSGVGGFSLGAMRAGFDLKGSVEIDPQAIFVYNKNFPKSLLADIDISTASGSEILQAFNFEVGQIDGIIGGPPCQGFSNIGLRDTYDPRNQLFIRFFDIVNEASPKFFLAENVPGILSPKNIQLLECAMSKVVQKYEILPPVKLTAAQFGVPTTRKRVFFFGYLKDRINSVAVTEFMPKNMKPVYVKDALKGLPRRINPSWLREEDGWRRIDAKVEGPLGLKLHSQIPDGVGHQEAITRLREESEVSGCLGTRHSPQVLKRYSKIEQGKTDRVSKSRRLDPNGFCPTLRAGTGSDKGSHQAVRPTAPHRKPSYNTERGSKASRIPGLVSISSHQMAQF